MNYSARRFCDQGLLTYRVAVHDYNPALLPHSDPAHEYRIGLSIN